MTAAGGEGRAGVLSVGLTGGIACGRSTVCSVMEGLGACVVDMDEVAHRLMEPGGAAVPEIRAAFGPQVVSDAEGIDRKKLGGIVFRDREARSRLEAILHPMILAESDRVIGEFARRHGSVVAVSDGAVLIETGGYRRYDRLVVVVCDPRLQLERLMARDGLSETEARARIDAQMPVDRKRSYADYLIDTSGSLAETEAKATDVYRKLQGDLDDRARSGT
jgi:dephospho-CoA kinase